MNDDRMPGGCEPCGCGGTCGTVLPTPAPTYNPPGQAALAYRAGTHGQFMASMLERIAAWPALSGLRTRAVDDPAIALLDCWAVVADILSFYVERVAQEGYVGTATEPESLAHLGRLVGYWPRPPLGAGGYLAYTLDPDARAVVPAGSQAKSVPAQGQLPQTFETSEDLLADAQWNTLSVRLTAPPRLDPQTIQDLNQLTLAGAALNLRAGDRMLLLFGADQDPAVRVVAGGTPDFALGRTVATLVPVAVTDLLEGARTALAAALESAPAAASAAPLREAIEAAASQIGSDGLAATDVYAALADASRLLAEGLAFVPATAPGAVSAWAQGDVAAAVQAVAGALSAVAAQQRRSLPQVEYLRSLATALACPDREARVRAGETGCDRAAALVATASVLPALRRSPSRPPAAARYLAAGFGDFFDPRSDAVPGLLAAADPRLSDGIHRAWVTQQIAPPPPASGVQVLRIKARPLAPPPPVIPVIGAAPADEPDPLYLEGALDGVLPGSWLVTEQRGSGHGPYRVQVRSVTQTRIAVPAPAGAPQVTIPVTVITVDGTWHDNPGGDHVVPYDDITVWAGGEDLTLVDDPITDDVSGSTIELAQVYTGLKPGRRLVVSGERTDIPGTTGVTGSELTMLAAVQQSVDPARGGDTVHPVLILAAPLAYTYKRATVRIDGNVVSATAGETRSEALGSGDAGRAGQSFALRQVSPATPLTYLPSDTAAGADAALAVRVDAVRWHPSDDLTLLGPLDHGYLLTGNTGAATVTFGDGVHGARLTTGVENVTATYRVGAGSPGNLPPGRITQLVSRPLGVNAVTNPIASTGGTDADGPQDVRAGIPLRMHALDRLLSVRDYADFSRSRPGIGRAAAARLYDGVREVVHVTVAAADDVPVDVSDPLMGNLAAALADFGDPHTAVRVDVRELVVLVLSAGIKVLPDYSFDTVEPAVRASLLATLGFAARDLAQPAYLSEALAAMQAVPGVDYADVDVFTGMSATADPLRLVDLAAGLHGAQDVVEALPARADRAEHVVGTDPTGPPDTLTSIALRHAVSVEDLVGFNPALRSVQLHPGQHVVVFSGIRPAQLAVFSADLPETLILRRIP